ncbi:MAG: outer membrane protein assembly factor BamB, partial [Burkholderiales bacterium]
MAGVIAVHLHGCGLGTYVSDFMAGEENTTPPAPLTEFEPTTEVEELWSVDIGAGTDEHYLKLAPAVAGETVFIADRDGEVYAVDINSGDTLWERDTGAPVSGGAGIAEEMVLLGTQDGEVLALSRSDGALRWTASVSSEVLSPPAGEEGIVVARTVDGKLFGIDAANGKRLWTYDRQVPVLTLRGTSAPIVVAGLCIAGFDSGALVALEIATGKVAWEIQIAQPRGRSDLERMVDVDADLLVFRDTLYVATYRGRVAAVSIESGRVEWDQEHSSYAGMGVDADNLYLSDDESIVWALDRFSGSSVWRQKKLRGRAATAPASVGDYVVVGDLEGYLH